MSKSSTAHQPGSVPTHRETAFIKVKLVFVEFLYFTLTRKAKEKRLPSVKESKNSDPPNKGDRLPRFANRSTKNTTEKEKKLKQKRKTKWLEKN